MKLNYSLNLIVNCVELVKSRKIIATLCVSVLEILIFSWNIFLREKKGDKLSSQKTHRRMKLLLFQRSCWNIEVNFFVFFFRNEILEFVWSCLTIFPDPTSSSISQTETFNFRIRSDQSEEDLFNSKLEFLCRKRKQIFWLKVHSIDMKH